MIILQLILLLCCCAQGSLGKAVKKIETFPNNDVIVSDNGATNVHYKVLYEKEKKLNDRRLRRIGVLNEELHKLKGELKLKKKRNDEVTIPLCIRHMAVTIENECPIAPFNLPSNVPFKSHIYFTKDDIYRIYKFTRILKKYKTSNLYVDALYVALENDFKNLKNINKIEGKFIPEFESYKLKFCKSVVTAILAANKLQTHIVNADVVKNSLSWYTRPIDRFMMIFYHALVAHPSDDSQVDDP